MRTSTLWFTLATACLIGALGALVVANYAVEPDNIFMAGDQATAANYVPAIVLAVVAAVALIVGAIYSSSDS